MSDYAKVPEVGEHKCAYCGNNLKEADMVQHRVRHFHTQRHLDAMRWYCRDKGCANYHQMSLEG